MDVYKSGYVIIDDDLELCFVAADSVPAAISRFYVLFPDAAIIGIFAPVQGAFA